MSLASARRGLAVNVLAVVAACGGDSPVAPPPATAACVGAEVTVHQLEPGEGIVLTGDDAACFALAGGGASYLLAPQLTGSALPWAGYGFRLGPPSETAALRVGPSLAAETAPAEESLGAQDRFDARLRARERGLATRGIHALPLRGDPEFRSDSAEALRRFQVLAGLSAEATFEPVDAALRYAGTAVMIYVDTAAASAFDDATIQSLGARLDALTPVVHDAFGAGSDVDANGRVLFLLTPVVNALVTAAECPSIGYVRGFFLGEDLTNAATSNASEIFYGYVPDPTGRWSCVHSADDVLADLPPTYVHELQHLVSFGEHVVARSGPTEEVWLNEGLSHLAEELGALYYEERFPAPLGRSSPAQIFPDSAGPFITPNLLASYRFLLTSAFYSLAGCAPGSFCTLAERGGTWLFLRWMADHLDAGFTRRLVQTSRTGRSNIEAASGEPLGQLLGDYAIAVVADSAVGAPRPVSGRHRFTSRNLRQLYQALFEVFGLAGGVGRPFPIAPIVMEEGVAAFGTMRPSTAIYYRMGTRNSTPAVVLRLTDDALRPYSGGSGAQVSILRVP